MSEVPAFYNFINSYNTQINPSSVHVSNTGLAHYFKKYLLQKAMSIFKWEVPETWSMDYLLYTLYCYGYVAIFNTNKFGVIPQQCGLQGYDIFYRPSNAIIVNPLFTRTYDLRIGKDCTLLKLQPSYSGIMDIVSYYADLMALTSETLGTNILNSKLSYVFTADSKGLAETMKRLYDDMASGKPAVIVDSKVMKSDGSPRWIPFTQNVGQNFIAPQLLETLERIEDMFNTDIGIPNSNTFKKERLTTDEVNKNDQETQSKCSLWLEQLQDSVERTNKLFGTKIKVDFRVKPEYNNKEEGGNEGNGAGNS